MPILYPPHPALKISADKLGRYEATGKWVAQRKFNGTHVLLYVSPERDVTILTRHGSPPKLFSLTNQHKDQILSLNLEPGKDYWLDGELLDHKTKSKQYKGKIVLFDVLHAGRYLINQPDQIGRLKLLSEICRNPTELEPNFGIALRVTEDVWMAETWTNDFERHFEEFLHLDEIEGLLLRRSKSFLDSFGQKEYDVSWMVRCRKPHPGGTYIF
jgi:hypothetical protein